MRYFTSAILAIFGSLAALAVPAKPTPIIFTQPDGTELSVTIRGDERFHWYQSEDGYVLVNQNNTLYYGTVGANGLLQASAIEAAPQARRDAQAKQYLASIDMQSIGQAVDKTLATSPRLQAERVSAQKAAAQAPARAPEDSYGIGLFPGTHFPVQGEQKAIVILVEYSDVSFKLDNPLDYFTRMLNQANFSDYNGTGSARDFFVQNSNNQFLPDFDVYGPVTLPNNRSYYGGNDSYYGNDKNPEKMAIHACQILDDEVDFSQYDRDGDGYIDNVFIFYAGAGEASGGGSNTVWPHSWEVTAATTTVYKFDNVRLDRYACSNEWEGSRPDGIGTFVHEFSHVIGLPDLYATNYSNAFTPGAFSTLDYGPYNNNGLTPPCYGAFERNALGWLQPEILTEEAAIKTLNNIAENQAYLIPTSKSTEFFLLENRQKEGWDKYIPGHGMLVWHIDYNSSQWTNNTVNNSSSHQYVDIEEADNIQSDNTRTSDPFPGASRITELSSSTKPALKTWAGVGLDVAISNIKEENGVISFFVGDVQIDPPGAVVVNEIDESTITTSTFTVTWSSDPLATSYEVRVVGVDNSYSGVWKSKNVGNATQAEITSLKPSSTYAVSVVAYNVNEAGPESNSVQATTLPPTLDYFTTVALAPTEVADTFFTANWELQELATDYILNLERKVVTDVQVETIDFADGVSSLPSGWATSTMFTYTNEENAGENPPSLRFITGGYIESRVFEDPITAITFWYKSINVDAASVIEVKARVTGSNAWQTLSTISLDNGEGKVFSLDNLTKAYEAIRLDYKETVHRGSLAIDDITIVYGGQQKDNEPVEQWTNCRVGDCDSFVIYDLEPETTYVYTVQAVNDTHSARKSSPIEVTTAEKIYNGLENITAEEGEPTYYNLQGIRVSAPAKGHIYIKKQGTSAKKVIF